MTIIDSDSYLISLDLVTSLAFKSLISVLIVWACCGCGPREKAGQAGATNLSVVVWPSISQKTNSYRHAEHLQKLLPLANALIAINPSIFSQSEALGQLANDSPLRALLGVPREEPAYMTWGQTSTAWSIYVHSSVSEQRFGKIVVNLGTGRVDSVYDVEALFVISEMERRLRQVVGTREEALRLFRGGLHEPLSNEQKDAVHAIKSALFLPEDVNCHIQMSAPGGSNRGQGYLHVSVYSQNSSEIIARVSYPRRDGILSAFGLGRADFPFGGLWLAKGWTNWNTERLLLDSNNFPYPNPQ